MLNDTVTAEETETIFSPAIFKDYLLQWIISDDQPFTVVEGSALRKLLHYLRADITIPTGDTIKENIMKMFELEYTKLEV